MQMQMQPKGQESLHSRLKSKKAAEKRSESKPAADPSKEPFLPTRKFNPHKLDMDWRLPYPAGGPGPTKLMIDLIFDGEPAFDLAAIDVELKCLFGSFWQESQLITTENGLEGSILFGAGILHLAMLRTPYPAVLSYDIFMSSVHAAEVPKDCFRNPIRCEIRYEGESPDEIQVMDMLFMSGKAIAHHAKTCAGIINLNAVTFCPMRLVNAMEDDRKEMDQSIMPYATFLCWTGGYMKETASDGMVWYSTRGYHQFRLLELALATDEPQDTQAMVFLRLYFSDMFYNRKQALPGHTGQFGGNRVIFANLPDNIPLTRAGRGILYAEMY
jgi:hypothetical protein